MKNFILKHKQLSLAAALAVIVLLVFGVTSLAGFIRDFDKSEADKLKERADRYLSTSDFRNAVNLYNMALEKDPAYEEIYIILHDYYLETGDRLDVLDILEQAVFNTDSAKLHALYEKADRPLVFANDDIEDFFRRYEVDRTYEEQPDGYWHAVIEYDFLEGELWRSDFDDMTEVVLMYKTLEDLEFLKQLRNIESLYIQESVISDLSALGELTTLRSISIGYYGEPLSLPSLSKLTLLENLWFNDIEFADFEALNELPPSVTPGFGYSFGLWNNNTVDFSQLAEFQKTSTIHIYRYDSTADLSSLRALSQNENFHIYFIFDKRIPDLSPLNDFAGSVSVVLYIDEDADLSALYGLTALRSLSVTSYRSRFVLDLSPLANLTNLEDLHINTWQVSVWDISPLANLKKLENLTLSYIENNDISPLAGLTALKNLSISGNLNVIAHAPYDLSPLAGLTELISLSIDGGYADAPFDISPLSNLTKLEELILPSQIVDISALANLTSLVSLRLDGATNITSLSALENLTSLQVLSLERCYGITDITPLAGLVNLESLDISRTGVTDVYPLAGMSEDLELRIDLFMAIDTSPIQHIIDKGGVVSPNVHTRIN